MTRVALSPRTRQRLAGWTCVLSYGWALAAPIAHASRVLPLEGSGRYSQRDALNRPETITQGGQMTRYGYDLAGRAVMLIGGNGQVTENTYDAAGRLTNRVLFRSLMEREQDDVMAEFGWAHDAVGNVVAQHEVWPGSADRGNRVRKQGQGATS